MKKREVSLTTQAIIIISLLLLVANVIMGVLLMTQSKNAMKTLINRRMLDISNTAAATLDGDVLERLTAEDRDTEEYRTGNNIAYLNVVKHRNGETRKIDLTWLPELTKFTNCAHPEDY